MQVKLPASHPSGVGREAVTCGTGTRNTDLSQRDMFLQFHCVLAQIFLDSECPLLKEHDYFKCYAGFTKVPSSSISSDLNKGSGSPSKWRSWSIVLFVLLLLVSQGISQGSTKKQSQ